VRLFITKDAYSCDVSFDNAGNLPAKKVRWFIDRVFSDDRVLNTFAIKRDRFEGGTMVIAPDTHVKKGAQHIEPESLTASLNRPGATWLYVWGRVEYEDGFEQDRFTNFCF